MDGGARQLIASEVMLSGILARKGGRKERVPAFWGGGQVWRVRYAPHTAGRYEF